jgi:D-sedoheptulose 7-phosphate isomerase
MIRTGTLPAEGVVRHAIQESIKVQAQLLEQQVSTITHLAGLLVTALRAGGKLVLFGNGGSAADAQHVAAELVNRFRMDRDALAALALTTDTSILTSVCNDAAFDQVFSRQVRALVQRGDVAVGMSTSGNSPNVINGLLAAKEKGATTVGFTGHGGGELENVVDICCRVPSESTPRIQEAHITVWHAICEVVEKEMFGGG